MKKPIFAFLLISGMSAVPSAQGAGSEGGAPNNASDDKSNPSVSVDPDGNWPGLKYKRVGNKVEATLDVVTIGGKTYLVSDDIYFDGKRDGMMRRVFADGTVQFEDWEGGTLMQKGSRGDYGYTIAPQERPRSALQTSQSSTVPQSSAGAQKAINLNGEWVGKTAETE